MENKLKHLEFIQSAINRMAGYSFLLKGWTVTLVVGLFVLMGKDPNLTHIFICFPILVFWLLDGYFLSRERLFRVLYDKVRKRKSSQIDFSMDVENLRSKKSKKNSWLWSIFSTTLFVFYFSLLVIVLLIIIFLK